MATYLFKTEPGEFAFADLPAAGGAKAGPGRGQSGARWDGVENPTACQVLRAVKMGDEVLVYHTGDEKAVVGLAVATCDAYADPKRPHLTAAGVWRYPVVDLVARKAAGTPVTLAMMKADKRFANFVLLKQARLSVMAVEPEVDRAIRGLAGLA
ncbi:MAG: EVE domain-containing protein [Planctomycetaceae bacterium]|jgi:predicted RNA-binding protein with PUA-like domain|nr:EVE domain-containing protein [Phycisphaerales bacterium]MCE2654734.1 EVE domain-containing protein [Planctomycetaceae bacterium]